VITLDIFHQRRHECGDPEKDIAGQVELDVDMIEHALPEPVIARQVQRFFAAHRHI